MEPAARPSDPTSESDVYEIVKLSAAVAATLSLAAGCASETAAETPTPPVVAELQEVAELLRASGSPEHPPAKPADLAKAGEFYNRGYAAVKSGDVVVLWGSRMPGEGEVAEGLAPKIIVAYEKQTPAEGGHALFLDGTIESLTADEFKAAPKAK